MPSSAPFFHAPAAGRQILAGFSSFQRIGKSTRTRFWIPETLGNQKIEWAAVRQFELLREAGNLAIDDLDVSDIKRSFQAWSKMRAGGASVTVMTLGRYGDARGADDLFLLDQKLQTEITQLIHLLYLADPSAAATALQTQALSAGTWDYAEALPAIALALNERKLFRPAAQAQAEETFFAILDKLPRRAIMHEVAVGQTFPEATKEAIWVYLAKGEHKAAAFFDALGTTMNERITMHMRGYGDRLSPRARAFQRQAALSAA